MYLSVCVRDFKFFKCGQIFNTYYKREKGFFVRNQSNNIGAFENINNRDYKAHFMELNDEYCFTKPVLTVKRNGFLNLSKTIEIVAVEKSYRFDTDFKTLVNLHILVFFKLDKIKEMNYTDEMAEEINELLELLQFECRNFINVKLIDITEQIDKLTKKSIEAKIK